ncbi:MAG: hypothetical protein LQ343_004855 [Gyalolechia ehrenbergii]|nr:MAG: hypothetical protein LQ343_004855 [Gyalolechia ehrenbergii]
MERNVRIPGFQKQEFAHSPRLELSSRDFRKARLFIANLTPWPEPPEAQTPIPQFVSHKGETFPPRAAIVRGRESLKIDEATSGLAGVEQHEIRKAAAVAAVAGKPFGPKL